MIDPRPIALIGYRGTGKTSVAAQLAQQLGWDWIDADVALEARAGMTIAEVFSQKGEPAFRDLEVQIVGELCTQQRTILALGGGAVLRPANRQALHACQAVVWLRASAETIAERLAGDSSTAQRRPNLTIHSGRTEIEALLTERTPIYRACATLEVDTEERTPAEIAGEILATLTVR